MVCIGKIINCNGVEVCKSSSLVDISMFVPLSSIVEAGMAQYQDEKTLSQKTLYVYIVKKYSGIFESITAEQKAYMCDNMYDALNYLVPMT